MPDEGEPRNPVKDFGWMALFLIVLGVIWFAQGGPSRLSSMTSPFVQAPNPVSSVPSQEQPSSSRESLNSPQTPPLLPSEMSPYDRKVSLNAYSANETDPRKEYVEISASYNNTEPILITGWTLEGYQGFGAIIGKGAYLVFSGQVNVQDPIFLQPGERAIITTGHSPIGTNFRENICTGYFNQFQNFYPSLSEECPRLSENDIPISYPKACVDFVKSISGCRMPLVAVPPEAGNDCAEFVSQKANYNGCVMARKDNTHFYKPEWRIYLDRDKELWASRDIINLKDQNGKVIDRVSYSY